MDGLLQRVLFQGWEPLLRTAVGTTVTYVASVILLRIVGQRTLAKWYAFDLVVTVALGSTFANSVLSSNIRVVQSLVGFPILIGLQFIIAFSVVRWSYLRVIVNPRPTYFYTMAGSFTMRCAASASQKRSDVRAAVRRQGIGRIEDVDAVVLEADGTFRVIKDLGRDASALADIRELGGSSDANRPTTE